jgi:isoleucyl-tRNA synthetase
LIDRELVEEMGLVMRLVSQGHAARNTANLKLRQPLAEAAFAVRSAREQAVVERYAELIAEELNVKQVRLLDTASEVVKYQLHPLPKQLGQKYGADFPPLRQAILELDPENATEKLLAGELLKVDFDGQTVDVLPEEVEVRLEPRQGFAAVGDSGYVAALDTEVTQQLRLEGLAREVVRRVQDLRKEADFEVEDRIRLELEAGGDVQAAIESHADYIRKETLADEWQVTEDPQGEARKGFKLESDSLTLAISRLS